MVRPPRQRCDHNLFCQSKGLWIPTHGMVRGAEHTFVCCMTFVLAVRSLFNAMPYMCILLFALHHTMASLDPHIANILQQMVPLGAPWAS